MITYKSMATTFKYAKENVEDRIKCGAAIYGEDNMIVTIADTAGVQPSKIIFEEEGHFFDDRNGGRTETTSYSLREVRAPVMAVYLGSATKEDLNLFIIMANPNLISDSRIQDAFYSRLEVLQAEEAEQADEDLTSIHEAETVNFKEYMGYMKDAKMCRKDTFRHRDYSEDKEYPRLSDVIWDRYQAGNFTEITPLDMSFDDAPAE